MVRSWGRTHLRPEEIQRGRLGWGLVMENLPGLYLILVLVSVSGEKKRKEGKRDGEEAP